jgi:hypothetical protein
VEYPATIQLSRLVNSLKGRVVSHSEEAERPRGHAKALGRPSVGSSYFAAACGRALVRSSKAKWQGLG